MLSNPFIHPQEYFAVALPFFGKKPAPAGNSASRPRTLQGSSPESSARKRPAQPAMPRPDGSLDFTIAGGDLKHVLAHCADRVHVEEGVDQMPAAAEEAAILYANGGNEEARVVLEGALETALAADARLTLWTMLLDLFRLNGQRELFEAKSLEYAREFERSAPAWQNLSSGAGAGAGSKIPTINLSGSLNAQAAAQFAQLIQIGMRAGTLRIDLSRLRSVDQSGAELLLRAVRGLRKARIKLYLSGCGHTAGLLDGMLARGRQENRAVWLLLLEILQFTDDTERFEERALDYALTFEESPPSWEPPAYMTESQTESTVVDVSQAHVFTLEGEILGSNTDMIRKLSAFVGDRPKVDVDCSRLRRLDFVSAGTLFNVVSQLHAQGRLVVLKGVNAMVGALMQVMGIQQVSRIELRG